MPDTREDVRRIVERVRGLLALAADASAAKTEEARTAALQAARLIKLHGLVVVEGLADGIREGIEDAARDVAGEPTTAGRRRRRREQTIADVVADGAARVARTVVRDGIADVLGRGRRRRR